MKDAGITAPVPRGDWQANVNYYFLNIVNHNGISWIAKRENLGQEPSDGLYWQRFGTSVPIATTSIAGIVKPDGATISVDASGTITVEIDGESIYIDDEDDKIKASLATLADVDVTDLADGYVLAWNATSETWEAVEKGGGGILPHLIIITEPNETSVKAVKGQTEIVAVETSSGHYECDVPEFGTWTIHAVLNGDDATVNLVVDTVKIYTVDDSHFHADITVTYPSGAQVSCSKSGETTLYATGSPYTFTVHSAGTWTITSTYNGVTITEDVVITTSGQTESVNMVSKTITVDIYSAPSDTVSFTDTTGAKTATTNSSGVASGVSIEFDIYAPSIVFTSSVAKDPDNLSNDYSKTVALTDATTSVYVMPEHTLYWYGYMSDDCEIVSTSNGWSGSIGIVDATLDTNYVFADTGDTWKSSGIGKKTSLSSANKVVGIVQGVGLYRNTNYAAIGGLLNKAFLTGGQGFVNGETDATTNALQKIENDVSGGSNFYVSVWTASSKANIYALWYE